MHDDRTTEERIADALESLRSDPGTIQVPGEGPRVYVDIERFVGGQASRIVGALERIADRADRIAEKLNPAAPSGASTESPGTGRNAAGGPGSDAAPHSPVFVPPRPNQPLPQPTLTDQSLAAWVASTGFGSEARAMAAELQAWRAWGESYKRWNVSEWEAEYGFGKLDIRRADGEGR